MFYYTVYLSDASNALNQEKTDILIDQLESCYVGNELSGMIACIKGVSVNGLKGLCIQVFEGPRYAVQEAISIIEMDPSRKCEWVYSGITESRNFNGILSAYEYINLDTHPQFCAIFELNPNALKLKPRHAGDILLKFLKRFLKDASNN
ncbi:MAG: BLUF domain-containing protein [Phormidesmis sp. FL-bin-119]|nr:BLUF domain-containing protein [Pedobacter sp.]